MNKNINVPLHSLSSILFFGEGLEKVGTVITDFELIIGQL